MVKEKKPIITDVYTQQKVTRTHYQNGYAFSTTQNETTCQKYNTPSSIRCRRAGAKPGGAKKHSSI